MSLWIIRRCYRLSLPSEAPRPAFILSTAIPVSFQPSTELVLSTPHKNNVCLSRSAGFPSISMPLMTSHDCTGYLSSLKHYFTISYSFVAILKIETAAIPMHIIASNVELFFSSPASFFLAPKWTAFVLFWTFTAGMSLQVGRAVMARTVNKVTSLPLRSLFSLLGVVSVSKLGTELLFQPTFVIRDSPSC